MARRHALLRRDWVRDRGGLGKSDIEEGISRVRYRR